ncbi:hypothetical protein D915_000624 [Fasciola hepatica]|uniref:Uncharacterized protein n=1 Tax=Fasciola hepatica TaxID=6192 RepID=A0A4E0S397_FASHE|nr:hypothetical protein D915_000624 [Fasciola hepatica]
MNVLAAHWVLEHRCRGEADAYAIRTPLGWTLVGQVSSQNQRKVCVDCINEGDHLTDRLEALWASEFNESTVLGKSTSARDKQVLKTLESSTRFLSCQFEAPLPWKDGYLSLSNKRSIARKYFSRLMTRLMRHSDLKESYVEVMSR